MTSSAAGPEAVAERSESAATFSEHWLSSRERFDAAARDRGWSTMADAMRRSGSLIRRLVDLGCGTGANQRYLAARLDQIPTHAEFGWLLIDADGRLLDSARRRSRSAGPRRGARTGFLAADLSNLQHLPELSEGDLVSASALIDLVSHAWLAELIERCRAVGAPIHWALTYDGRSRWRPANAFDDAVVRAFNGDQQSDKGFGVALGPQAVQSASALLEAAGYETRTARTDWRLDSCRRNARRLISPLLEGHARIARLAYPDRGAEVDDWVQRRRRELRCGRLRVNIGHQDLVAWPRPAVK